MPERRVARTSEVDVRISTVFAVLVLVVSALAGASASAADASLHEVYQAAQSGRLRQAEAMMDQVLRDHPASAKAHFVEAELLARDGRLDEARNELATAEKLQPGLAFAKPQAVEGLRARLQGGTASSRLASEGNPLSWLVWGGIALVVIVLLTRWMSRRAAAPAPVLMPQGNASCPPAAYGSAGFGNYPATPGGSGVGSGILGGLATGAAVGAGIVAGEALMHRVLDGGERESRLVGGGDPAPADSYDMGGSDFGVSGGWDDGGSQDLGSLGGDDWS